MDLTIDISTPTPRAANETHLAQYFGGASIAGVASDVLSWTETDHHHGLNLFNAPSLDSWSEDNPHKYGIDSPVVMEEADRLSNHSHSTATDSDSRGSSNTFSTGSLLSHISNGPSSYSQEPDWENFPVTITYSPHEQAEFLPTVDSTSSLFGLTDHVPVNPFFMYPSSDVLSPTINPATFNEGSAQGRSVGQIRAHPHSEASPLSASLDDRPCVSITELNAPYIPNTQRGADGELEVLSSSEAPSPQPTSRKRSRGVGSRGRGRGAAPISIPRSLDPTPIMSTSRSRRRAPSFSSSSSSEFSESPRITKRARTFAKKVEEELYKDQNDLDDDDGREESEASDSDAYSPSSSPSLDAAMSDYSEIPSLSSRSSRKPTKKSILKMSAAEALAQLSGSTSSAMSMDPDGDWDPSNTDGLTSSKHSRPIPVPVPVPHLTKKSRGRKVPYVNTRVARGLPAEDALYDGDDDDNSGRGGSSRMGRGRGGGKNTGGRSFVCTVEGCGKCFIRGEHLKRHVRSIHTNDKPHACPYPCCGKSFSRRDNLGQHVRLHLAGNA